ncbi:MAG: aminopeptidase P family protein [Anaerolineales bacterium]|nr:aminopeptidase P family protein [Anaerolineales bacterium]
MLFNRPRAVEYMRRCGLDALVAAAWPNITYFSDYYNWIDPLFKEYMMAPGASSNRGQAYALFPLEGEPALIVSPLAVVNAADSWVSEVHTFGATGMDESVPPGPLAPKYQRLYEALHRPALAATPTAALLGLLRARGLDKARIGLDMEGLSAPARAALDGALPQAQVRNCSNLLRLIRAVKSPEELRRLTRSAEINELAALESLALGRPGAAVGDLARHYRSRIADLGAEYDHYSYCIRGLGIAGEPEYRLAEDEVMFVDFGCLVGRYFSDTGMTYALRPLPAPLAERHAALRACLAAGMQAVQPGVRGSAAHTAMWQALTERGFTAINPHGHGLGLEIRDYPIVVAPSERRLRDDCINELADLPLEVDMVVNLESAIFVPGVGATHIERTLVVAAEGARPLTAQDRSGPVMPS